MTSPLWAANAASTSSFSWCGHPDDVERAAQFGGHLVELLGGDVELAMGLFQTEDGAPGLGGHVLEWPAGHVAHPQGAHELQAGKPAQILRVPLTEGGVLRLLTDDRVLHDGVAEVVDDGGDGEDATEPFVEASL